MSNRHLRQCCTAHNQLRASAHSRARSRARTQTFLRKKRVGGRFSRKTALDNVHLEIAVSGFVVRFALRAGADDYIIGPIDRAAVLDRVLSVQLPEREAPARSLKLGDLSLDLTALQARWQGKPIPLMPNELRLLRYLMEQPGHVFSRGQLIAALGKKEQPIDERTVDAWVSRLRRALREAGAGYPLRTVRSLGYVLDRP